MTISMDGDMLIFVIAMYLVLLLDIAIAFCPIINGLNMYDGDGCVMCEDANNI